MREDEELCRAALSTLLKQRGIEDLWQDGTEPPDWFLEVAGQLFAVEVTSVHGSTNLDGQEQPWIQVSKELTPFAMAVCREVEERVQIPGLFTADFPALPNIKARRSLIVQALVDYFEALSPASSVHGWQTVLRLEGREFAVYRITETGSTLAPRALWTGAVISRLADQLSEILPHAISRKALKMAKIQQPAILVILDEYGFQRSVEEWQTRLPPEASQFMAIVRVRQGNAEIISGILPTDC